MGPATRGLQRPPAGAESGHSAVCRGIGQSRHAAGDGAIGRIESWGVSLGVNANNTPTSVALNLANRYGRPSLPATFRAQPGVVDLVNCLFVGRDGAKTAIRPLRCQERLINIARPFRSRGSPSRKPVSVSVANGGGLLPRHQHRRQAVRAGDRHLLGAIRHRPHRRALAGGRADHPGRDSGSREAERFQGHAAQPSGIGVPRRRSETFRFQRFKAETEGCILLPEPGRSSAELSTRSGVDERWASG